MSKQQTFALYVHWPFCKSKCPYCDFNSHVGSGIIEDDWLKAYMNELEYFSPANTPTMAGKKIDTIFFGGGTPSLMPTMITQAIIDKANDIFGLTDDCEITLEANPTSIEAGKFKDFRQAGINRVSVGVQALNAADLKFLGREHSADEAINALDIAANTFDNFSFDLIYARPNQTEEAWRRELEQALSYGTKHLSLYQLTIEKGTKFYAMHSSGEFAIPDSDNAAGLYELTDDVMSQHGMPAYEISNYAAPGFECKHNLNYWHYSEYVGIGAGAHGRLIMQKNDGGEGRRATMMLHAPDAWLKTALVGNGLQSDVALSEEELLEEFLIMHLRLMSGIPISRFVEVFGKKFDELLNNEGLEILLEEKLLELVDDNGSPTLRGTKQGLMLLQAMIPKLI